jgi:hypothetical protein
MSPSLFPAVVKVVTRTMFAGCDFFDVTRTTPLRFSLPAPCGRVAKEVRPSDRLEGRYQGGHT